MSFHPSDNKPNVKKMENEDEFSHEKSSRGYEKEKEDGEFTEDEDEATDAYQSSNVSNNTRSGQRQQKQHPSPSLSNNEVKKEREYDENHASPTVSKPHIQKAGHQGNNTDEAESDSNGKKSQVNQKKNFTSNRTFQAIAVIFIAAAVYRAFFGDSSNPPSNDDEDWRLKVDPNNSLSRNQQFIVRASLKPILDKSIRDEESVSTLLILSSDEENAANIGRCILRLVNSKKHKDQTSAEIDLNSRRGDKLVLDNKLRNLLGPDGTKQAVLLRGVDDIPADDAFDQLRLLFAYCDGENPVFPNRLIIMTANTNNPHESELREKYKTRWPKEHDFIDALMSRISGHTLYVEKDQKSIC